MWRLLTFIFLAVLLLACAAISHEATAVRTAPTAITQETASAITPLKKTALATASPSLPFEKILADFPLSPGAAWKYASEISYQDSNAPTRLETWSGFITEQVVDKKDLPYGKMVFTLRMTLEPPPPQAVWKQPGNFEYIVTGDGVFKGNLKIYQWPLSDNLSWKAFPDSDYLVNTRFIKNVETPYSKLKDCYSLLLITNPDTSIDTFCPGIGFVEYSYTHHGTSQIEHSILVSYTPGK
jgi:hypothetical protein